VKESEGKKIFFFVRHYIYKRYLVDGKIKCGWGGVVEVDEYKNNNNNDRRTFLSFSEVTKIDLLFAKD